MYSFTAQSCPPLKVLYFDLPGKGEAIRLACAYGNLPWEDVRVSFEEFESMKASGKLAFGQLPALEVDNKTMLFQSASIMRFIGKYAGLYPVNDDLYAAKIDALVDQEVDLFTGLSCSRYRDRYGFGSLSAEQVVQVRKDLNDIILPRHLSFFENFVKNSSSGWLAGGENPSIADFILVPRLQWLASGANDGISTDILESYPHLKALIAKLLGLPAVVEYYASKAKK